MTMGLGHTLRGLFGAGEKAIASSTSLPCAGRIDCSLCHVGPVVFDVTRATAPSNDWRITANPLAWGNDRPEVLVLGFSKGPTQAGALAKQPHNDVPYRGGRVAVGKILAHVGLLQPGTPEALRAQVDAAIADGRGRFGWGSLIRCTVERRDPKTDQWLGTGGGMLDKFAVDPFGAKVARACATRFLRDLPPETKLVVMFGLGTRQGYVADARRIIEAARPGRWRTVNEVAYTDGRITVVHVEHFKSQGALIPNWLGENAGPRARLGVLAREAVSGALR
jgi:hypothetical protein